MWERLMRQNMKSLGEEYALFYPNVTGVAFVPFFHVDVQLSMSGSRREAQRVKKQLHRSPLPDLMIRPKIHELK